MTDLASMKPLIQCLNAIEAIADNLTSEDGLSDGCCQELVEIVQLAGEAHVAAVALLPGYAIAREIENREAVERGRQPSIREVPN